jgi:hypothetical protein
MPAMRHRVVFAARTPQITPHALLARAVTTVADHNSAKCNIFRGKVTRQYTRQAKELLRLLDLVPNLCQRVQKQEGDILRRHTCAARLSLSRLHWRLLQEFLV